MANDLTIYEQKGRQPSQVSTAELITICIILALASGGLSKLFVSTTGAAMDRVDGDVSFGVTALYIPAYLYTLWIMYRMPFAFFKAIKRIGPLWIPILFSAVSLLWSLSPATTGRRFALLLMCAFFSAALVTRLGRSGLVRVIGFTAIGIVVVQLLSAIVVPSLGMPHDKFYPAIPGLFLQKNGAGRTLVIGLIAGLALLQTRPKALSYTVLGASMLGVAASTSGTAIGSAALCLIIYYILVSLRGAGLFWLSTIAGLIVALLFVGSFGLTFLSDDSTYAVLGKDATLTGRTSIWAGVWRAINAGHHWWTGYGYEAFFASPQGVGSINWNMYDYVPPHAHNGLLQTWLNTGIIGVILTIGSLLYLFVRAADNFAKLNDRLSTFDIVFMAFFLLVNVTEQTTMLYNNFIWVMFVAVAALPGIDGRAAQRIGAPGRGARASVTNARDGASDDIFQHTRER